MPACETEDKICLFRVEAIGFGYERASVGLGQFAEFYFGEYIGEPRREPLISHVNLIERRFGRDDEREIAGLGQAAHLVEEFSAEIGLYALFELVETENDLFAFD